MSNSKESKTLQVLGLGNPLLDIVAEVPESLIEKYGLKLNDMHLAEERHMPLYKEIQENYKFHFIPGGATLNSIRFCQALQNDSYSTMFSGCIGDDKEGNSMKELLKSEGISEFLETHSSITTGLSAILVNNFDRAMCTHLGASREYSYNHFKNSILPLISQVDIIYSACYFFSSSPETMMHCGKLCAELNKTYCVGLGAIFIVESLHESIIELFPYIDTLFANKEEMLTFGKYCGMENVSFEELLTHLLDLPKVNKAKPRTIIATQGTGPVIVATSWPIGGSKISKYPVLKIPKSKIVDVNGGGDAFVGGYLYGLSNHKSLDECIYYGLHAASQVIQVRGAAFSKESLASIPPFEVSGFKNI